MPDTPLLEPSHLADVGGMSVRRALPHRARRTVGAWCFVDHFGPVGPDLADAMQIGPHPHIGLQTVTWLLEGALLHADSVGSEQLIRPGQLNLMTAGRGVSHAEEGQASPTGSHGAQLWIALPDEARWVPPAFEHHAELPTVEHDDAVATVLVGALGATISPATVHSPLLGADVVLPGGQATLPLEATWEHAIVVLDGLVEIDGVAVPPGTLAYLDPRRDELGVRAPGAARFLLLGGEPFGPAPLIWWNFVGRTRDEIVEAQADWEAGAERFGTVRTGLARIPAPVVPPGLKPR